MRIARSMPSSTRSTIRLVRSSSTRTSGQCCKNVAVSGAITQPPNEVGALTRKVPAGAVRNRSTELSAIETCSSTRFASSKYTRPASVRLWRRVFRSSRRVPSCVSSNAMYFPTITADISSRDAAPVKLPLSTTAINVSMPRSLSILQTSG
ncbi:hypothetical protein D3C78_1220520 [compost metagenome]